MTTSLGHAALMRLTESKVFKIQTFSGSRYVHKCPRPRPHPHPHKLVPLAGAMRQVNDPQQPCHQNEKVEVSESVAFIMSEIFFEILER